MSSTQKIMNYYINTLPNLIIDTILSKIKKNSNKTITVFDSTGEEIDFKYYFNRILTLSEAEIPTMVCSLILVDWFLKKSNIPLTNRNINKIFFISFYISLKHLEDVIYTISDFSKICGMSIKQISFLENFFLEAIDFSFPVTSKVYEMYLVKLLYRRNRV